MPAVQTKVDILVCGAGIFGASTTYHLAQKQSDLSITIVDADPECQFSSSERNAGGVRAFWKNTSNRKLALESIRFFEAHKQDFGFHQCGYLWMHKQDIQLDTETQKDLEDAGYPVKFYDAKDKIPHLPWDFSRDQIGNISFHPEAGLLNPNSLRKWFLQKAKETLQQDRFQFLGGWIVHDIQPTQDGWQVDLYKAPKAPAELQTFYETGKAPPDCERQSIQCKKLVLALGAWTFDVVKKFNKIPYTCQPVARHISFLDAPQAYDPSLPMVITPEGIYFHPEGGHLLAGYAIPDQKPGFDFSYDEHAFFESFLWPKLYEFSEVFASCKHLQGWAGMYSYSPDLIGILGKVSGHEGLYQIHSFTGRGIMMSPAAGRGLAELILTDAFETLDLSPLSDERFHHKTTPESNLI